ncbi:MAG: protein-L-isoaspartate O-methyltransferase [Pseudomonadota bacterium]
MTIEFEALRRAMVDSQVRTTDVTDLPLLEAMLDVPRELFVPERQKPFAYTDRDILLDGDGEGTPRYLMQASPFAKMVQLAEITGDDVILDIGCGLGYSAAILSRLGAAVIALESDTNLADRASEKLIEHGFDSVAVVSGPLDAGYADEGPYDVIMMNGSVDVLPAALLDQLKPGGRLVVVEGDGLDAVARLYLRDEQGIVSDRRAFNASVKPLPGFERAAEFEF